MRIRAIEAPLSDEQAQELERLLSSKQSLAEVESEIDRILGPEALSRARKTICGGCGCNGYKSCTEYVWVAEVGRWRPVRIFAEHCGVFNTVFGCLWRMLVRLSGRR